MKKKMYQEALLWVCKLSNNVIATSGESTEIEDWGNAGGGSGSFGEGNN